METNNSICLKVYRENDVGLTRLKEREKVFYHFISLIIIVLPWLGLSTHSLVTSSLFSLYSEA